MAYASSSSRAIHRVVELRRSHDALSTVVVSSGIDRSGNAPPRRCSTPFPAAAAAGRRCRSSSPASLLLAGDAAGVAAGAPPPSSHPPRCRCRGRCPSSSHRSYCLCSSSRARAPLSRPPLLTIALLFVVIATAATSELLRDRAGQSLQPRATLLVRATVSESLPLVRDLPCASVSSLARRCTGSSRLRVFREPPSAPRSLRAAARVPELCRAGAAPLPLFLSLSLSLSLFSLSLSLSFPLFLIFFSLSLSLLSDFSLSLFVSS
ncbi:hypothetical protein Scep_016821 [Stephania cephalantha]|uniref:Uncharacterized protein n=1 Tax=Stephania cephalantha TaxID=152367 RepID=A0AAP0IPR1_9MAGN